MKKERLFIKPFNKVFNTMLIGLVLIAIVAGILLKDKDIQVKKNILYVVSAINFVFYNWYKFMMSKDSEYSELCIAGGKNAFNWWNELPFHLCNVNLILIPLSILLDKQYIMACCFVTAIVGALIGISMPCVGLDKGYLSQPRILGFYGFHMLLIATGVYMLSTGIYIPKYEDIIPMNLFLIFMAFIAFIINVILRTTKLETKANFFYTMAPENNLVLQKLHKLIPVPFLFALPLFPIAGVILAIVTFVYNLIF